MTSIWWCFGAECPSWLLKGEAKDDRKKEKQDDEEAVPGAVRGKRFLLD